MSMMSTLRLVTGVLSLLGDPDETRLPRSLADDYVDAEAQDDPAQDPLPPPRPKKDDAMPRTQGEPLLEHPHESIPAFFRSHFSAQAWEENVWKGYLTETPVLVPLGLAVGAGAVSHWDRPLERRLGGTLGGRPWIGDATMASLVGGSVLLGVFFPGEGRNGWDNFWEEAEVLAVNAALTSSLKMLVGRRRPGGGNRSFPSGHTSSAFAAASLINDNSGGVIGVSAYGLAALTGYSRMEARRHYPSDVLAGAAIGILSAQVLDSLHWGNGQSAHGIAGGLRLEIEPLDRGAMAAISFDY
ncbi:MAG TPA: phosphatase PAP2 family protein [Planctomycetota bacterium]|nr:phosphatase PAP2 family protein [Planctomycetota bacterium]